MRNLCRYLCCHRGSSESVTAPRVVLKEEPQAIHINESHIISHNEPQVLSDDAPTLRICFATRTQGIGETWWECREYQIRFRDLFIWRRVFDTPQSESRWSLSTTDSTLSLEAVRASGKRRFRKGASTKTSSSSKSEQKMRLKHKQTDSSKQPQQPPTYSQSQRQHAPYSSAEDAEEEKRRRHKDALEQLEANNSQSQLGTLKHQEWSKLRMLIANGLDEEARGCFPQVAEGQEALLLPIEQDSDSFEVGMKRLRASGIEDAIAALAQIEYWKWRNVVIFVRDGDTPLEQTEWQMMEKPRVLDWALPFI